MDHKSHIPEWPYCDSNPPDTLADEKDACGVGFLAQIDGKTSHWLLKQALRGLNCMEHRGGCGGDSDSGDGAGLLCEIPWAFLKSIWPAANNCKSSAGLGMIFMPNDIEARKETKKIFEEEAKKLGLISLGWREVPINYSVLGTLAQSTAPFIEQWIVKSIHHQPNIENLLFRLKKRIQNRCNKKEVLPRNETYIASLSSRTVVYKGMVRSEVLSKFYQDLNDSRFEISFAIYHRRFSTNTLPRWPLAQPMRLLGHNGEINTLLGNLNWAKATEVHLEEVWGEASKDLKPVTNPNFSDSANLDATLELLVRSGRPITDSLLTLVPEAFQNQHDLNKYPSITSFYKYSACTQEAWDGPALLVFSDGCFIGATLDRNGLRPARYCVTKDNLVIMGSETGVVDIDDKDIIEKGRLGPGQMLAVDLQKKRLLKNWEVKKEAANRHKYENWISKNRLEFINQPWLDKKYLDQSDLIQKQTAFGFSVEDLDIVIEDMAANSKEPTYCMGDDIPLSILSDKPHILYDYFKQRFAQVTNPPIDPLREKLVMSLEMHLGKRGSPLKPRESAFSVININSPILNESELDSLKNYNLPVKIISTLIPIDETINGLKNGLERICNEASVAVKNGARLVILSDREINQNQTYIPPLLAVGAVHHHLLDNQQRLDVSIIVDTAQCWNTHHLACLIGYGASAVCPWLTWETVRHWWLSAKTQKQIESKKISPLTIQKAQENVKLALENGLRKILSKIGISLLASYHGAQIFEAVGIGADLIDIAFKGTTSRIAGLTLKELAYENMNFHAKAYPELNRNKLDFFGFVQYRSGGEFHLNNPVMAKALHKAVKEGPGYDHFATYKSLLESRPPTALRDLLTFQEKQSSISINEVESVESICKRFCTGGMSLGALSKEAHEVLAIAMNRIGGKSNSGEGGEDPQRFKIIDDIDNEKHSQTFPDLKGLKNGDTACSAIKQVASGRFGVTPEYLRSAKQLEIKVAQGAKPGEGGQLPGAKVDNYIARLRNSKPGVALISPPPHHDIYSIEDLAQLIHDLHQVHPLAKVSVKLVAEIGIGTIAAGVAKANADVIQISGHDGGTGASPLSSIKNAGLPWELGLTEVHKSLLENGLRNRVLLRADGGLKTGWDVVIAALLGAEEFGFGSIAMIAEGCIMARICHTNKCPVGIATQQEVLRKRFPGLPEHVVNFFMYIAEEVRQILSVLGVKTLEEIIGRNELLKARSITLKKTNKIDLSSLIKPIEEASNRSWLVHSDQAHGNGNVLEDQLLKGKEITNVIKNHGKIKRILPIINTDRSVCARIAGEIASIHGNKGFKGMIDLTFKGASGQSFGAFLLEGMFLTLVGEANDYVGKGMNGGVITLIPSNNNKNSHMDVILGNTCIYGGTGGKLFAVGKAGERFGVRNSGVQAVIEGAGDHCCEYMTGGVVVVLGSTGRNIGAGMTGGIAFILDEKEEVQFLANKEIVEIHNLTNKAQENLIKPLLNEHLTRTKSFKAAEILNNWGNYKEKFKILVPPSEKEKIDLNKT